jgi:hypothetical protein
VPFVDFGIDFCQINELLPWNYPAKV